MSIPQLAPLPGVLVLTTAPPLYIPTLLLSSHIRHPLKETYPRLLTEQWLAYLSSRGCETSAHLCEPVVWLKGVPPFPTISQLEQDSDQQDDPRDDDASDHSLASSPDQRDEDGNVWRGMRHTARRPQNDSAPGIGPSDLDQGTSIANLTIGQVTYLAPIPPGTNPLLPLAFLHHFHAVLLQYFPSTAANSPAASSSTAVAASIPPPNTPCPIPASTLASNFDLLYQVLQEMLDEGRPLTTDYNSLKAIVRGKAWWEDILTRMSQLTSSAPAPPPQISPLPWRPAGVRYSRNEVYVDIVETLTGVMDRKGKAVAGLDLHVSIACRAKLSGDPDLTLALHPAPTGPSSSIGHPSLHPCVRQKRWSKEGILSFVPPDGEFQLAEFPVSWDAQSVKSAGASRASSWERDVPFALEATRSSNKDSKGKEWTFELRLSAARGSNRPSSAEGIELSFFIDSSESDAPSASSSSGSSTNVDARTAVSSRSSQSQSSHPSASSGGSSTSLDEPGTWRFDARRGILHWSIAKLGRHVGGPEEVVLKGSVTGSSSAAKPSSVLTTYSLPTGTPSLSGLKVASLQVRGVEYKPFKGVRGVTRGQIEWRW